MATSADPHNRRVASIAPAIVSFDVLNDSRNGSAAVQVRAFSFRNMELMGRCKEGRAQIRGPAIYTVLRDVKHFEAQQGLFGK